MSFVQRSRPPLSTCPAVHQMATAVPATVVAVAVVANPVAVASVVMVAADDDAPPAEGCAPQGCLTREDPQTPHPFALRDLSALRLDLSGRIESNGSFRSIRHRPHGGSSSPAARGAERRHDAHVVLMLAAGYGSRAHQPRSVIWIPPLGQFRFLTRTRGHPG